MLIARPGWINRACLIACWMSNRCWMAALSIFIFSIRRLLKPNSRSRTSCRFFRALWQAVRSRSYWRKAAGRAAARRRPKVVAVPARVAQLAAPYPPKKLGDKNKFCHPMFYPQIVKGLPRSANGINTELVRVAGPARRAHKATTWVARWQGTSELMVNRTAHVL